MTCPPGRPWRALLLLVGTGCGLTPLDRRIAVGEDPFLIFVAEGIDGATDLFASTPAGENAIQLTFTRQAEQLPALAPGGTMVAYVRGDTAAGLSFVVLNLLSGAERDLPLPDSFGLPTALGWTRDGAAIALRTPRGVMMTDAPPGQLGFYPVTDQLTPSADSALAVLLGEPPFARVVDCEAGDAFAEEGRTLCVESTNGEQSLLVAGATNPMRWGRDSVAYQIETRIVIRPLGGGRSRQIEWRGPQTEPRSATLFLP